jgi:hypothetical protein
MKLYTSDNTDLMEVSRIYPDGADLIVEGTIMGAMPVRAVLKPAELRKAFGLMSLKTLGQILRMLFRRS